MQTEVLAGAGNSFNQIISNAHCWMTHNMSDELSLHLQTPRPVLQRHGGRELDNRSEEDGPAVPCRGSLHHAGSQRSVAGDPACGPGGGLPRQSPGRWRRASGLLPSLGVHQKGRIDLAQREFVNSQYPRHTRLGHGKPVTLAPSRRHAPRPTAQSATYSRPRAGQRPDLPGVAIWGVWG